MGSAALRRSTTTESCVEWIAAYRAHAVLWGPFCADIAFELDPAHSLEFLVRSR